MPSSDIETGFNAGLGAGNAGLKIIFQNTSLDQKKLSIF